MRRRYKPGNNPQTVRDFTGPRIPGLVDLRDTLLELGDQHGLAGGLERYIGGTFAGFFTGRPTIVTNRDYLTVFKIREVSRELQPLGIAMVIDWCWSLAVRERVPRQFVCDELWSLSCSVAGGELVEKFARRNRKLGLSLVVATQNRWKIYWDLPRGERCWRTATPNEIRLKGQLNPGWASYFEGFSTWQIETGQTLLTGEVAGQSALHGLLALIRDLGILFIRERRNFRLPQLFLNGQN